MYIDQCLIVYVFGFKNPLSFRDRDENLTIFVSYIASVDRTCS